MAANELYKGESSFGLANSILIQVFIARHKANQLEKKRSKFREGWW